eukprot:GHVU01122694.1.p1 GENE.GHVU01122694.1~~GHVU01122694.1.p1  ORF type:complete len:134 (+),score=7.40 GHVU01122694.1:135-536(+)
MNRRIRHMFSGPAVPPPRCAQATASLPSVLPSFPPSLLHPPPICLSALCVDHVSCIMYHVVVIRQSAYEEFLEALAPLQAISPRTAIRRSHSEEARGRRSVGRSHPQCGSGGTHTHPSVHIYIRPSMIDRPAS